MKKRKIKGGYILLCALMATIVVMSLVVLPHAATEDSDTSATDSQELTTEVPVSGEEVAATPTESPSSDENVSPSSDENVSPSSDENASPSSDENASPSSDGNVSPSSEGNVSPSPTESVSPSPSASPSESPAKTEYSFENDDIIVTAVLSDAKAIPANAEFCVVPITSETDSKQYDEVEAKINKNVEADNQTVTDFLAYDIYFMADGNKIEPELGNVTVTIQYKNQLFDDATEEATDEIKVLHLEETDAGIQVTDVTQAVDLLNTGFVATPEASAEVSPEPNAEVSPQADSELSAGNSVKFVTDSFSTFVVTGVVSNTSPKINVTMKFMQANGTTVDTSAKGTYYLNVTDSSGYRYNLPLNVVSGKVTASITGLYNQNGDFKSGNTLYPLTNNGTYTAVLYESIAMRAANYTYNQTDAGITEYTLGSTIADIYTVTVFSKSVAISSSAGTLTITAKKKTDYSRSYIYGMLTPVQPYAVFADYFAQSTTDMEGSIAVNKASIGAGFGNTNHNYNYNYGCAPAAHTITVNKTYNGSASSTAKTFTFALYKSGTRISGSEKSLVLAPNTSGTVTFSVTDSVDFYTVQELDSAGNVITNGSTSSIDGFKLMSIDNGTKVTTASSFNTSYIKNIDSINGTIPFYTNSNGNNMLVVGNGTVGDYQTDGSQVGVGTGSIYTVKYKGVSKAAVSEMPDITGTLGQMATLSTQLAQAMTNDSVLVKNYTAAQIAHPTINNMLTFTTNDMLVINIDATNTSILIFSANAKLVVNGKSVGGWEQIASKIIINIYEILPDGTYVAYDGVITDAGNVFGIMLAPYATVQNFTTYNGKIIAKNVYSGHGEIHGCLWGASGSSESKTWTFVNTALLALVLPETGGSGTYIFYGVGGGIVLLAAVLMIIYLKRGKQKQERKRKRRRNRPSE